MLNADELRKHVLYDPETGFFVWATNGRGRTKRVGERAGSAHSNGYIRIKILGQTYFAHRLAWLLSSGDWPAEEIDHINGNRDDNRIDNLREATVQQNRWNTHGIPKRRKHSRFKGVTKEHRSNRWISQIFHDGKPIRLGSFDTEEQASEAYLSAARRLRGGYAK
ncbi:hypothetical protein ABB29_12065 [Pseudoxanthomonas dokdonensis]|uniref:AP2/ERF domain-containing protein n=2 Tax=Pseudoxanthomonas dokdonensis TaxID=344882 RepID=A0A0R0CHD0_9GAMM|nr:hypothetical protein ABB29_12065 [Pseudoxanthomonas dokdonensis]